MIEELLHKRLIFVTGKGGVGKSTIAAALGSLGARRGLRVLIVEVDGKGDVGSMLGLTETSFTPQRAAENLWVMEMDTEAALAEYLRIYVKVPFISKFPGLGKIFDFVSTAAPGVREILVIGKLCYEVRQDTYDLIVVDPPASGHVISQLGVAGDVGQLIQLGLVKNQTEWMLEILADPERSVALLVATPEETPIEEALDLAGRLRAETPVRLEGAVVNRRFVGPMAGVETEVVEAIRTFGDSIAGLNEVLAASDLFARISDRHDRNLRVFVDQLGPSLRVATVGEYFGALETRELVDEVAEVLEVELW
ncbi:MAG: ArsA family ATPase [Ferrimicrobium sp.]|uniref:ArsA family ATPase n=1 Tax=Ferrimicrobium sp. TaxID=2926050 RepID=UPI002626BA00|nr:ArsA family ATPase [Ferrimicrobium sp.]